jgi:hypothetical protein
MKKVSKIKGKQKTISLAVTMFALVGLVGVINYQAFANPPGIPQDEKKVYQWMLIGRPNPFNGECGEGNRIFVEADDNHAHLVITDGNSWNILNCNATGKNKAVLQSSEAGSYKIYASAKGKPGTGLDHICVDTVLIHDNGTPDDESDDVHDCLIGSFDIKREGGKTNFKLIPSKYFDASLEDIIWSMDVNGQAKIQFRVMKA